MKRPLVLFLPILLLACGRNAPPATPAPAGAGATSASSADIDALWAQGTGAFRRGEWQDAAEAFERLTLELPPGDARLPRVHFFLGEAYFAQKDQLRATREFRRVSDDYPEHELAPEALLRAGDAYADLWRRPELDPTYGQTALSTYQELLNRYPSSPAATRAQAKIARLQERFAAKLYKAALFYFRVKAYDSAILYLRDLVTTYPRTRVAPTALVKLVDAYRRLGYREEQQETCDYIRQYHPGADGVDQVCPRRQS
ncbi:MAG TPA: outer membrane protein assembly factor BamD [Gemmatimonadales bacterium]|nr:outer membrane protein assembly factor BamD [Gemmatimonadales bacterium]